MSLRRILIGVVCGSAIFALAVAIVVRQPSFGGYDFPGQSRSDPRRLRAHVVFLARELVPRSASHPENLDRAGSYVADHFRRAGARVSEQRFEARGRMYRNVIGDFGPTDRAAPVLVLGAHYDAFGDNRALPAADDNASGTAGLLELARLLGTATLRTPVMLVAYSTEEPPFFGSGEMGSAVHAESLAAAKRRVEGMICLEMIGYFADTQSWPAAMLGLLYPTRGNFIAVAGGWPDRKLARRVKRAIRGSGGIAVYSFTGSRETSDASDQRNYWGHGWPAVIVTDTGFLRNPNYHTADDTAETLDYEKMARVVDGVFSAVVHTR